MPRPRTLTPVAAVKNLKIVQSWLRLIEQKTGVQRQAQNAIAVLEDIALLLQELRMAEREILFLRKQLRNTQKSDRDTK